MYAHIDFFLLKIWREYLKPLNFASKNKQMGVKALV